jgi:uncharacterized protein (DUF1330 family)
MRSDNCRGLCRSCVGAEMHQRRGTRIEEHLKLCSSTGRAANDRGARTREDVFRAKAGIIEHYQETKAYWDVYYRSISEPAAREAYTRLAVPAVLARGGRFLARGNPAKTYEGGIDLRTVLIEFDSLPQRSLAHDSPGYQAALAALGNSAERDVRILEGVDG